MQHYLEAKRIIAAAGGGDFEGVKPDLLVAKAETALGIHFPPTYRRFLLEMGCGDINGVEIFGLINDNFEHSTVPNGIWLTLNERHSIGLNAAYVLIGDSGDGSYYALDTRHSDSAGEVPVVHLSLNGKVSEKIADSFGAYLLGAVKCKSI